MPGDTGYGSAFLITLFIHGPDYVNSHYYCCCVVLARYIENINPKSAQYNSLPGYLAYRLRQPCFNCTECGGGECAANPKYYVVNASKIQILPFKQYPDEDKVLRL